ncbi:hypothetical protein BH09ACT12_BH09ACT12_21280 [soil metagenome]
MITDRTGEIVQADHRRHAEVELTIRDLKHDMALNRFPTKSFGGNAAWLILNTIAPNLPRWTTRLGLETPSVMTKKIRPTDLQLPGRLVRTARPPANQIGDLRLTSAAWVMASAHITTCTARSGPAR